MSEESETALLMSAQAGDLRAMEHLLTRYEARVYRYALRMCGNDPDARDVAQETLLTAFRNLAGFRGEAQLSTWLYQVARSHWIKQRRRGKWEPAPTDYADERAARDVPDDRSPLDHRTHARQVTEVIQAAMNTLSDDFREALVLRDVEELTAEEAADVVGIEVGALKSRLHRARLQLKKSLAAVLEDQREGLDCPGLKDALSAYAFSDIDQAACIQIETHMEGCVRCTEACDSLRRTVSLCRAIPGGDVPAPVKAAVRQALGTPS
jgi:RNA polymerase sigma-70 factor (ECF subfamily)